MLQTLGLTAKALFSFLEYTLQNEYWFLATPWKFIKEMNSSKILIVEDERHIARFLEYVLQREGYQIAVVNNGADALKAVPKFEPNVILLDLGLPDMNGIEVLKQIRSINNFATPKVVVLTATLYDEVSDELNQVGVDAQCSKPIAPTTLIRTMQEI
ncbi:MAG: response regulator [Pyrinomonadaceae bacterium]|nr:response regulator [Pyrinomonadaceae bacterium]